MLGSQSWKIVLWAAPFLVNEDIGIFATYRKSGLCNVFIILPLKSILDIEMEYKLSFIGEISTRQAAKTEMDFII